MVLTKNELRIFSKFRPFHVYAGNDLKGTSNNALTIALKRFKEYDLIQEKQLGRSKVYRLNLEIPLTITLLEMNNLLSLSIPLNLILKDLTPFTTVAVFGSYASGTQKKESDLDIVILSNSNTKAIKNTMNRNRLTIPMDAHVFTPAQFMEMLEGKEENLGKQIMRNHKAVHNSSIFYEIVKDAARNIFDEGFE